MGNCDRLSYTAFHDWYESGFAAFLRAVLGDAIENFDTG